MTLGGGHVEDKIRRQVGGVVGDQDTLDSAGGCVEEACLEEVAPRLRYVLARSRVARILQGFCPEINIANVRCYSE